MVAFLFSSDLSGAWHQCGLVNSNITFYFLLASGQILVLIASLSPVQVFSPYSGWDFLFHFQSCLFNSACHLVHLYRYQANRTFIIGRIKTIFPKILCALFDLSAIDRLYKESLRCRSQIMPGRTFRRKKNKAIGRTHFNNKKVAF